MSVKTTTIRLALCIAVIFGFEAITPAIADSHGRVVRKPVIVVGKAPRAKRVVRPAKRHGLVDFNVTPRSTEVWVDGIFRGTADALDGFPDKLSLKAGKHQLKLVSPEGTVVKRKIKVVAGEELNIGLKLD